MKMEMRMETKISEHKEVGRIQVSPSVAIVVSKSYKRGELTGISINKFISSDDYRGYAKGEFIPKELYREFKKLISDAEPK